MASQVLYPATIAAVSSAPYDDNNWTSVANMASDNGLYASITASTYDALDWSYLVRLTNFGFSAYIPAGATIDGIQVEIEGYRANGSNNPGHVQLTKNGTAVVGQDRGVTTIWPLTTPVVRTFGGATDLWGTTWTAAEVSASTFGVHFANYVSVNDADVYIDYVRITVWWTPTTGGAQFRSLLGVGR